MNKSKSRMKNVFKCSLPKTRYPPAADGLVSYGKDRLSGRSACLRGHIRLLSWMFYRSRYRKRYNVFPMDMCYLFSPSKKIHVVKFVIVLYAIRQECTFLFDFRELLSRTIWMTKHWTREEVEEEDWEEIENSMHKAQWAIEKAPLSQQTKQHVTGSKYSNG